MKTDETRDQLRARDGTEVATDIDELVIGPTREDRPLLRRRALTGLVSGAAVLCAVGLAAALTLNNGNSSSPAQPAASSSTLQSSPVLGVPTASAMTQKQLEILAVVKATLPGELKVAAHHVFGESSIVAMAIPDSQGLTWVDARVGTTGEEDWDHAKLPKAVRLNG